MLKLRLLSLSALVAGLVLGLGALSPGGDSAQAQEATIQGTLDAVVAAWNGEDFETFISYFTDEGLAHNFEVSRDEAVDFVTGDREETGPIASAEASRIRLSGGVFTAIVDLQFEAGFSIYEEWEFYMTDDGWKIGAGQPVSRPIPPGVPAVDLTLQEYAFVFNEDAVNAADGNFAFKISNAGEEEHEVVLLSIDSNESLLDLLMSSDPESEDLPAGVGFVTFGGFFAPGDEGTVIFSEPLSAGKYGLVCFVPSPEGTPHAFLGMVSEFTVGGGPVDGPGGGITPPSTGDAGLLGGGSGYTTWLMLGLALTLILGGAAGFARSRAAVGV